MEGGSNNEFPLAPIAPPTKTIWGPVHAFSDIVKHRFLVWSLVKRNLRSKYRAAGLSYFWMVLEPLLLAITYWFLFIMLAGNPDELYPVWVLVGVIVWSAFGKSLSASVSSLTSNTQIIQTAFFPRIIFPFSSTLSNILTSIGSSLVLLPIIIFFNTPITIHLIWVPIGIIFAGVMGGVFGIIFAPLNCRIRDIEHFFKFIVRAGFFFSPVMWTAEMALERGELGMAAMWNPMTTPITMVRHGINGNLVHLPTVAIFSFMIFFIFCLIIGPIFFIRGQGKAVKFL